MKITANDMRDYSRSVGLDPDRWNYVESERGFDIRRGAFICGSLIFEDQAQILVDALNKRDASS